MFGNKIGKIVGKNVNVEQVKTHAKDVASEVTTTVVETGVDAVAAGAKGVVHGIMFTVAIWVIGIAAVITGFVYGVGTLFN